MKPETFKPNPEGAFGIRLDELKPEARFYADNLNAQILQTYRDYGVQNMEEFLSLAKDPKKVPVDKLRELKSMVDKLSEVLETGEFFQQLERLREKLKLRPENEFFSAEAIRAFRMIFEGLGEDDGADPDKEIVYRLDAAIPEIDGTDYLSYSENGGLTVATGIDISSGEDEPSEIITKLARMQRTMNALRAKGYVFERYGAGTPYEFVANKEVKPADLKGELKLLRELFEKAVDSEEKSPT